MLVKEQIQGFSRGKSSDFDYEKYKAAWDGISKYKIFLWIKNTHKNKIILCDKDKILPSLSNIFFS